MESADKDADIPEPQQDSPRQAPQEHKTLKYSLLGPSLLKAGQDAVDQRKVSEIIYNASKGSKFFNHEESRDKVLTEKISQILARKARLERLDLSSDCRRADEYIAELELSRDLTQTVVHVDCDAFFAAVEELDRPELKTVPMAVGKGVLTTCNYVARKYGCRSGMASFVAKKLCPELICLPQNYQKYSAKAEEIRAVFVEYDPCFESASIDEAYLNITAYCDENNMDPQEAVQQMRARICEETKITVSAGIAANAKLAKIASNQNKPNGQFYIPNDREEIMSFIKNLPVRKVNGIGRVFERELKAIGIETCGEIYPQRAFLKKLFGEKAFQFLMQCYLGLGRTKIQPAEEYERKSVGTESTFSEISDKEAIHAKLRSTAEELEKDLAKSQCKGRTLVLKIKLHTFEVYTRQVVPPKAVCRADDLYAYALPIIVKLEKEIPNMRLRLLGLRCTNLVSTKKGGLNFFGFQSVRKPIPSTQDNDQDLETAAESRINETQLSAEQDFENAARQEREDEINELEKLSQEYNNDNDTPFINTIPTTDPTKSPPSPKPAEIWTCPICSHTQPADDKIFNEHVDYCLSKGTILEAVQSSTDSVVEQVPSPNIQSANEHQVSSARKRKSSFDTSSRQRRLFFA
ncbi:putative DNA-directed polymerase kappa [Talaromyces proteolyticus]|uniref:DNA polymerase kappa n=1 Tax=Talaromyces proteolyticus TaxID=1131652 RepID=A0AAD4KEK5_9EURO|nr:putative DNA-directed polymerase kappa [Talaromyces proteolyticus]KAH8690108.1 putative DNA-directed polymerase kappa [Talaromyces proteolyticus]